MADRVRKPYPFKPVTLGDLIESERKLWVFCVCGHQVEIDPASLPLPRDFPVPAVRERMVCGERRYGGSRPVHPVHPTTGRACQVKSRAIPRKA